MPKRAPQHRSGAPAAKRHQARDRRPPARQRGYDYQWDRLRRRKIEANPICEHCSARGVVTPTADVDHIEPFSGLSDPRRLDWGNLQSLCRSCHNRKTAGERR